ncbi:MAG: hypothetical protein KDM64_05025 [Verrucomicrobiae bacterium]|nr:hypothetical protein [Verrucomicrobiae bacterium]
MNPSIRFGSAWLALWLLVPVFGASAADEAKSDVRTEDAAPKPAVTKIGDTTYRLGEVTFDAKTREVRLPTVMNLREGGPIEYLLVHENGKVHEGMLTTKVSPMDLQIVLKLLRYRSGEGHLFDTFLPAEEQRQRIEAGPASETGDKVTVSAQWTKDGENHETPVAGWILDAETGKAMTDEPWTLTGSHVDGGTFLAEAEGSIIAVYLDQIAMLNMGRKGAENDERWGANPALTPEVGQKITLVLRPAP